MRIWLFLVLAGGLWSPAWSKPIGYAGGTMLMAEYGTDLMQELQGYYAPRYWWSHGAGLLRMEARDGSFDREIVYLRGNALVRRWNLPGAQGNVFASAGVGRARGSDFEGPRTAWNAVLEADYETRRIYVSAKHDWHSAPQAFAEQMTTLQAGFAPYEHDWDVLATWFLLQARHYRRGMLDDGWQTAAMLRWFKRTTWVEAGITDDGRLQTMIMLSF